VTCPERERLAGQLAEVMKQIIQIALRQRTALKTSGRAAYFLDQEFVEAVGEKERLLGALVEHEQEHGCAPG
jgi:hypothetical protein